jgi:hypothetical protein
MAHISLNLNKNNFLANPYVAYTDIDFVRIKTQEPNISCWMFLGPTFFYIEFSQQILPLLRRKEIPCHIR